MSLCINPDCPRPDHPGNGEASVCQACGTNLVLQGRYRVMRLLSSQTGFGMVYAAYERDLPKILKVLRSEHSQTPKIVSMFQQEALTLSQLSHPGVPFVNEDGYFILALPNGKMPLHCIVMEKIDGINLTQWMKQQGHHPIREQQAIQWLTQLVEILQQIHQNNYFHRDIKPENVMIRTSGQLALVDFGTAREMTQTYFREVNKGGAITAVSSAGYTPPEQEYGQAVPQSDFYALGRTLIYLVTAKAPTDATLYDSLENRFVWRSHAPQISAGLGDLLDSMIAPRVADRPASAEAILTWLEQLSTKTHSTGLPTWGVMVPETTMPNGLMRPGQGLSSATSLQMGITTPSWQTLPQTMFPAKRRRRWRWALLALVGLGVMGGGAIAIRHQLTAPQTTIPAVEPIIFPVQLQRVLSGHTSNINDLILFADGLRMVTAGTDKTIRFWDLTSGQELQTWKNQTSFVNTILLNPDETRLYSGNADGALQSWTTANGNPLWQHMTAHTGPINTLGRTPDGKWLVSGGADGAIHIWEASTGKEVQSIISQQGAVNSLLVTSDGQHIISGGSNNTIKVWDITTSDLKDTLKGHQGPINKLAISPDGQVLFSASADKTVRQWELKTGKWLDTLSGHTSYVNDLVFSPDGSTLSTASADQTVRIWNLEAGATEQILSGFDMLIDHVVVSSSGQIVTASKKKSEITIWHQVP